MDYNGRYQENHGVPRRFSCLELQRKSKGTRGFVQKFFEAYSQPKGFEKLKELLSQTSCKEVLVIAETLLSAKNNILPSHKEELKNIIAGNPALD